MPQLKHYTAKREMRMDCGHTVKEGEAFHIASVFTCDREGSWPLRILMACFTPKAKRQPQQANAQPKKQQDTGSKPASSPKPQAKAPVEAQAQASEG